MINRDIETLFQQTLVGNYDDDGAWDAVHNLRRIGTEEIFEKAVEWCRSENPLMRARGADVLSQLGVDADGRHAFQQESYLIIAELLQEEKDSVTLEAGITALGHLHNPAAIPLIIHHYDHANENVRFSVAFALGKFADDHRAAAVLLRLMLDEDCDVRDWATFGIGDMGSGDTQEIRDALFERLDDIDSNTRLEAMIGLAKRKDLRVLPALFKALDLPENEKARWGDIEAACFMLDMEDDNKDWKEADYIAELRKRFPNV